MDIFETGPYPRPKNIQTISVMRHCWNCDDGTLVYFPVTVDEIQRHESGWDVVSAIAPCPVCGTVYKEEVSLDNAVETYSSSMVEAADDDYRPVYVYHSREIDKGGVAVVTMDEHHGDVLGVGGQLYRLGGRPSTAHLVGVIRSQEKYDKFVESLKNHGGSD